MTEQLSLERLLFAVVVLVKKLQLKKQPLIVVVVLAELSLAMPFSSLSLSEEQERLKVRRRLLLSKKIPAVFAVPSGLAQLSMEKQWMEQLSMEPLWMEQLLMEQLSRERRWMATRSLDFLLSSLERQSLRRRWLALLLSSQLSLSWTSWGRPERRP